MILLQYVSGTEFQHAKKETRFGKLVAGTDYENRLKLRKNKTSFPEVLFFCKFCLQLEPTSVKIVAIATDQRRCFH